VADISILSVQKAPFSMPGPGESVVAAPAGETIVACQVEAEGKDGGGGMRTAHYKIQEMNKKNMCGVVAALAGEAVLAW